MEDSVATRRGRTALASSSLALLLIVASAVATRIVVWWNPVPHVDDPFYVLVGQELLNGNWPYTGVWDRKPLGLFLLYAIIGAPSGGSMIWLNLIATGFAIATAWMIRQISLGFTTATAATFAAITYLLFLPLMHGQTGQAPVFYNLLMAGAALMLFRAADSLDVRRIRRLAFAAMLLCGLSIWIKQIAFIEGAFIGLAFLWLLCRRGQGFAALAATGAAMILIALAPNIAGLVGYALASREALDAYVHANFISIFQRTSWGLRSRAAGLVWFAMFLYPLLGLAIAGMLKRWRATQGDVSTRLLVGWTVAALIGYLSVPEFFQHYALPLLLPLCIAAAPFFSRGPGPLYFGAIAVFCLVQAPVFDLSANRTAAREYAGLHDAVDQARHGGCIYLADGPTRLYSTTGACTLTRFLFPDHLNIVTEARAIGTDPAIELARVLAQRPAVIVTQDRNRPRYSADANAILATALRDYRIVYRTPLDGPKEFRGLMVWQRRDLAAYGKR